MPHFSKELLTALDAIKKAEIVAMKYFHGNFDVSKKQDGSPVTTADTEVERIIIETIRAEFPSHAILGEESGKLDAQSAFTWVIDPIDGTKNFVKGIPLFGILIGLVHDGECILGVSSVPGMHEVACAEKGIGAFINGKPIHVSDIASLSSSMVTFGGLKFFSKIKKTEALLELIEKPSRVRSFGDAYAYHLVASGKFEAVVEAKISYWDVAAPCAIIEAAGGRCTDLEGLPLGFESTTVIATNGRVHDEILEIVQKKEAHEPGAQTLQSGE